MLIKENKRAIGQHIQNNCYIVCCSILIISSSMFLNFITQIFAKALIYNSLHLSFIMLSLDYHDYFDFTSPNESR